MKGLPENAGSEPKGALVVEVENVSELGGEKTSENCPCMNMECPRYGKCDECQAHHKEHGSLTCCGK